MSECVREATLGEEIISLTEKGVDIPTVERMYRKYIAITSEADTKKMAEEYCCNDVNALFSVFESVFRKDNSVLQADIKVGDQIVIPLGDLGTFTATAQKVMDGKVLFIFDDYIAKRPMNENGSNEGGYEKSDLKKWIENDLFKMFPEVLRNHMTGLTIPTLGEICGWDDKWDRKHIEADGDEQLPLMKQRRNRVAYYNNECECGWLRNATKKSSFSDYFVFVSDSGDTGSGTASSSCGVRPEFLLSSTPSLHLL